MRERKADKETDREIEEECERLAITTFLMYEPIRRLNNHLPQSIKIIGCLWANLIIDTSRDEWFFAPLSLPLPLSLSSLLLLSLSPSVSSHFSIFIHLHLSPLPSVFLSLPQPPSPPAQHRPLFFPQPSGNQENEIASTLQQWMLSPAIFGLVGVISPINESCPSAMPKRRYQGLRDSLLSSSSLAGARHQPPSPHPLFHKRQCIAVR